jgi:hypothetical protein
MPRHKRSRRPKARRRRNARGWFTSRSKGSRSEKLFSHPTRKTLRRRSRRNPLKVRRHRRNRVLGVRRHRRSVSRRHNPFQVMGRRGSFGLIPSVETLKTGAVKGIGVVAADFIRATGYTFLGRQMGLSIVEDTVARIAAGWAAGTIAGFVLGGKLANDVYEGNITVTMYELLADVAALATKGQPKLLGFVANPYVGRPQKAILPSFGAAALPAMTAEQAMAGLGGVIPEGEVIPLGGVIPEGQIVPIGGDNVPRFRSRF